MKSIAMLFASLVLIASAPGASAQHMYRCGSVYQDRPCASGAPEKVMHSGAGDAASTTAIKLGADPYCIKRGADAQQIVWARETGKTAEEMGRQAQNDQQRRLIAEVYAQRGTAPQVRDAIQAQCQRDKDLMGPGVVPFGSQGGNGYTTDTRPMGNSETARDSNPAKAATSSSYDSCDNFKLQRESIRSQERQGGNVQFMESLSQRRSSMEKSARAQGC